MITKNKIDKETILSSIAPCGLFCTTCTGCKYGEISKHAKELLHLLEGHEEFLDKNLKPNYRHKLEEYKLFHKKLKKYAYPKCEGCRNTPNPSCSIKGCVIPSCTKEHNVDFCADCNEFPCLKVNEKIYKSLFIEKWKKNNEVIKEKGIQKYYEENKNISHYRNYKI